MPETPLGRARGKPKVHPVDRVRTKLWFQAVKAFSGKPSAYAVEMELDGDKIRMRMSGVSRPRKFDSYSRGDKVPTDRRPADRNNGYPLDNSIEKADARWPGTAAWFRHPIWRILKQNFPDNASIEIALRESGRTLHQYQNDRYQLYEYVLSAQRIDFHKIRTACDNAFILDAIFDLFIIINLSLNEYYSAGVQLSLTIIDDLRDNILRKFGEWHAFDELFQYIFLYCLEVGGAWRVDSAAACARFRFKECGGNLQLERQLDDYEDDLDTDSNEGFLLIEWKISNERLKGPGQRPINGIPIASDTSFMTPETRSWVGQGFWLSEEQFERLAPYLPANTRGKPRVDDRRVISGIIHVLVSGCRWKNAPPVYGPRKTLYNRFQRWAAKGVWSNIFHALATAGGPPAEVLIDSSGVRGYRCASDVKGGSGTS